MRVLSGTIERLIRKETHPKLTVATYYATERSTKGTQRFAPLHFVRL